MTFQVGDRVRVTERSCLSGRLGTVLSARMDIGVQMDAPFPGGHRLGGAVNCPDHCGWWFLARALELADRPGAPSRTIGEFFMKQEQMTCPST